VTARRAIPRWWPCAAGVAAVAVAVFAARIVHPMFSGGTRGSRPELRQLLSALTKEPTRPAEGRLTGGFDYAPPPAPLRGPRSPDVSPDVRLAAATLEKLAQERSTPAIDAALGAAYVAVHEVDKAIAHLEAAVGTQANNGYFENDLAVAYLVRARARDRAEDLPRALSAAERADRKSVV